MAEEYLQTAFELKTICDELSRRLLRWHWENQEQRTMRQLAEYLEQRKQQAPDYFDRVPSIHSKTTWQQLDTTFCMRILLDPGEGQEGRPLRLLSAAPRPVVARQACNGLRMARNAAAHATELKGAAEAAALFSEAIESLEDGYDKEVFTASELEKYRKAAARAVNLCRGAVQSEEAAAPKRTAAAEPEKAAGSKRSTSSSAGRAKTGSSTSKPSTGKTAAAKSTGSKSTRSGKSSGSTARSGTAGRSSSGRKSTSARPSGKKRGSARKKKRLGSVELLFLILGAVVLLAALWLRGNALGLFGG